jgi:hypothetical protein
VSFLIYLGQFLPKVRAKALHRLAFQAVFFATVERQNQGGIMNSDWDYQKSVDDIGRRRRLHPLSFPEPEDIEALKIAREHTRSQGSRTDLGMTTHTWAGYCESIGIPRTTILRWMRNPPKRSHIKTRPATTRQKLKDVWYAIRNLFR